MPWKPKQKRYLLSSGSPLSKSQKTKMVGELHANPAMGHAEKADAKMHAAMKSYKGETHNFKQDRPKRKVVSRYS